MDLRRAWGELTVPISRHLQAVTATGRAVATVAAAAWLVACLTGWAEFQLIAASCLVALVIALLLTLGRASLVTTLAMEPPRVTVGEHAAAGVSATNTGTRRTFGLRLEVPVGQGAARFDVPALAPGGDWADDFVIPTTRRCVLTVGPVRSVREDPLGLIRRGVSWSEAKQLYVHPKIVRLPALTAGWIRDLEGRPTTDLSPSDIAFHTLREYMPGDDRRHIHWKSTARQAARQTTGTGLVVRQFNDSRRSHLGLLLSTASSDYASEDEFELAVSVAGSLGATALLDDQTVSMTTGQRPLKAVHPMQLLDRLSEVEVEAASGGITQLARQSLALVRGAGVVAVVAGSTVDRAELRRASETFHHDVRVVAFSVRPGTEVSMQRTGVSYVLELGRLDDLARVLRATVSR